LGCGTGNHSVPLARRGYRVSGIDRSASMIAQAKKKASRLRNPPRFVRADMRTFRLGQRFDAALCLFGAFGYLLTQRDVLQALGRGKFELLGAFAATNVKKGFGPVTRKTFRVMVVARAR